jgi:hypothetical protein
MKPTFSGSSNWGPQPCYFNSALTNAGVNPSTNATLTIYLRLFLLQKDAKHLFEVRKTQQQPDLLRDWGMSDPFEFAKFRQAVKENAEKFWDKRFCLVNISEYSGLDVQLGRTKVRPNVDCRLEIVWSNSAPSAHQIIKCFCVNPGQEISSFVEGDDQGNGIGQFANDLINERNNFILDAAICKRDVGDPLDPSGLQTIDVSCPRFYKQDGIAHEIGHLIGLPHVGVARRGHACLKAISDDPLNGVNAHACYREPSYDDADNIMGIGDKVAPWNTMPWLIRLFQHTGIGPQGWKPMKEIVPPKIL